MDFVHSDILNEYGKMVVDKFLDKCRANGSYKIVYEDFTEGTRVLQDAVENLFDVCAWLYLAYDGYVFDVLDEWRHDGFNNVWDLYTYEEVESELHKMYNNLNG